MLTNLKVKNYQTFTDQMYVLVEQIQYQSKDMIEKLHDDVKLMRGIEGSK